MTAAQNFGFGTQIRKSPALVLSETGVVELLGDKAAIDFVSNAFAHCKAIGHSAAAAPLLRKAGVVADDFVVPLTGEAKSFVLKLSARNWSREEIVKLPV